MLERSVSGVAAAIRAGRLSPVEVTDACLSRIARLDPALRGSITVAGDRARAAARTLEAEAAAGRWRGAAATALNAPFGSLYAAFPTGCLGTPCVVGGNPGASAQAAAPAPGGVRTGCGRGAADDRHHLAGGEPTFRA
jgi:hypothetical protein